MEYEQEHHHHTDDCCCGHDHEHEHDDDCCCGHDHDHDDDCCCGHDHEHEHGHRAQPEQPRKHRKDGTEKRVYVLEGLDCPNCAAKIEKKIREMPEVEDASLVYPTRQLQVTAAGQDELLPAITALVQSVEP